MNNKENSYNLGFSIFRKKVLQKNRNYLGKVVLIRPISFSILAIGITCITITVLAFLYFGEYTRKQEVFGILVPDKDLIEVYSEDPGIVVQKFVQQGDSVKKDQPLCMISTKRYSSNNDSIFDKQVELMKQQIEVQKDKITVVKKNFIRYEQLFKHNLISESEYEKHKINYLSKKFDLYDLEYRLNQIKGSADYIIRAPIDGFISTLIFAIGENLGRRTMLLSLIPKDSKLEGVLYVPSHSIGFVQPGQKILLKYQAYPYQQFGLYESVIYDVDKSILSSETIKTPMKLNIPVYRVKVFLSQQTVIVYGKPRVLKAGMAFNATILGEKYSIWKWIMRPIYSLKGI